jgi:hypothetical protein
MFVIIWWTYAIMIGFTDINGHKIITIPHLCTTRAKNEQKLSIWNKSVIQVIIMHYARDYLFVTLKLVLKLRTLQQPHNGGKLCLTME